MIELKKGDKVILKGFTGIKLGVFEIASATKKTVTIVKKNGDEMVFDRKTGRQINVEEGKEKYANAIMEDDGSFVAPSTRGAARKATKKAPKAKSAPAEDEDDEEELEDDEDDEDEEPVKPSKKPAKKTPPAKKPAKKVVEEDDDDDDFEEVDE